MSFGMHVKGAAGRAAAAPQQHHQHRQHQPGCCSTRARGGALQHISRAAVVPRATYNNEADSMYSAIPLQKGIIERRLMEKQMGKDSKAFSAAMKVAEDEDRKATILRRESRGAADTPEELVEYFLNTAAEDMDFEVARNRPKLSDEFFKHLDNNIGALRFASESEEEKETLVELEALRTYLEGAVKSLDHAISNMASAKDRMAKLLSAKDKKDMILTMAEAGEIDQPLMDLLNQNIQAARAAQQEDAAGFMEKVMRACGKYYVAAVKAAQPPSPAAPAGMPAASAAGATIDVTATSISDASKAARRSSGSAADMGISRGGLILPGGAPASSGSKPTQAPPQPPKADGGSGLIIPGR